MFEIVRRLFRRKQDFIPQDGLIERGTLPRTLYDYGRDVRHGFDSNVIMAPVMWIMRNFTEAQAVVQRRDGQVWVNVEDHRLTELLQQPNPFYDGDALWKAITLSYLLSGNAYWRKVRNRFGEVLEYWYIPHWMMCPKWPQDGSTFISHYEYYPGGPPQRIEVRDVVHLRLGLDPLNTRLGFSQLRPLLREIFTDDEAQNFSAKILQNMGVPGLVLSPKNEGIAPSPEDLEKTKEYIRTAFTGDNRGAALLFGKPTEVAQFGFDPNKLMLAGLRDISEERVCAMLGLPAAVVGFGSGNQSTKVGATMRELKKLAWVSCLTPMQKSIARQLTAQILPDFQSQTKRFRVQFDTTDVAAFQEEDDLTAKRAATLVQAGILRVDRAQEMVGAVVDPTQKVYLRPSNSLPIDENGDLIPGASPNGAVVTDEEDEDDPIPAAIAARRNGRNGNSPDEEDE